MATSVSGQCMLSGLVFWFVVSEHRLLLPLPSMFLWYGKHYAALCEVCWLSHSLFFFHPSMTSPHPGNLGRPNTFNSLSTTQRNESWLLRCSSVAGSPFLPSIANFPFHSLLLKGANCVVIRNFPAPEISSSITSDPFSSG